MAACGRSHLRPPMVPRSRCSPCSRSAASGRCAPCPRGGSPPPARPVRPLKGAPQDAPKRQKPPRALEAAGIPVPSALLERLRTPIAPLAAENDARNGLLSPFRTLPKGMARPDLALRRCPRRAAQGESSGSARATAEANEHGTRSGPRTTRRPSSSALQSVYEKRSG